MDDVNACESDVVPVLKTLEGNKNKRSLMETMDAALIDYQMDLQERLDHIITYKAVFSEYRKFKTPTKKGGAQPQSDALSQALKDLRGTCQVVPPVVVAVECELQSTQYLKDEEFDKYIGCLAAMQSNTEFISDALFVLSNDINKAHCKQHTCSLRRPKNTHARQHAVYRNTSCALSP